MDRWCRSNGIFNFNYRNYGGYSFFCYNEIWNKKTMYSKKYDSCDRITLSWLLLYAGRRRPTETWLHWQRVRKLVTKYITLYYYLLVVSTVVFFTRTSTMQCVQFIDGVVDRLDKKNWSAPNSAILSWSEIGRPHRYAMKKSCILSLSRGLLPAISIF